jgi:hypothetical protein
MTMMTVAMASMMRCVQEERDSIHGCEGKESAELMSFLKIHVRVRNLSIHVYVVTVKGRDA